MTTTSTPVLAREDVDRLLAVVAFVEANDTESVLATVLPSDRGAVAGHVTFTHAALMIFPDTLDGLARELARHGLEAHAVTPSVVVRDRVSRRYGVRAADLTVGIVRAPVADRSGRLCEVEIFAMATPPELAHIAADERRHGRENHVALALARPDSVVVAGVRSAVMTSMRADGGGYSGHEDATVLYFHDPRCPDPVVRRLELYCPGRFPSLLATHRRESDAGTRLLRLMTGAWATQAIATAVELDLPDRLAASADLSDLSALSAVTGADRDGLARLLRYLTALDVVDTTPTGYALTDTGALLRADADGSMRALALMYGGPFYRSFAALTDAVRTGTESYAKVFGAHHFTHMAADPGLAGLFHQSMAASNAMFAELVRVVDFTAVRTVVDVAGGNGELLARILHANPAVHGVLLERPHALSAAEHTLAAVADRATLLTGDFTEQVPDTGDVYLLSRVLHDWDDPRCHTILTNCVAGMPDHAELLIIERLLPPHPDPHSLAVPWDIHMLCNVGGQERTEAHYRTLLTTAGLNLTATHPLPLDAHLLRARKHHANVLR